MFLTNTGFVCVLEDNNGQWWCVGYDNPARVETAYANRNERFESNSYQIEINTISNDHILTAIDKEWVKQNILT